MNTKLKSYRIRAEFEGGESVDELYFSEESPLGAAKEWMEAYPEILSVDVYETDECGKAAMKMATAHKY